jgi:hypothetical protein
MSEYTVTGFYDSLRSQGLSARSVWCVHLLRRRYMEEAARGQAISYNPVRGSARSRRQRNIRLLPYAWGSSNGT